MGSVEHPDLPGTGQGLADPPEEVVFALLLGRGLNAVARIPLGVDLADDVAHDPALAGGVHPLHHEEDRTLPTALRLRVELLLPVAQLGRVLGQRLLALRLPAVEPRRAVAVDVGESEPVADAEQLLDRRRGGGLRRLLRHGGHPAGAGRPRRAYSPHAPPLGGAARHPGRRPRPAAGRRITRDPLLGAAPPASGSGRPRRASTARSPGRTAGRAPSTRPPTMSSSSCFEAPSVVVVGAGTLRSEGYTALSVSDRWRTTRSELGLAAILPLVCVSNSGEVPPRLRDAARGTGRYGDAYPLSGLDEARALLGDEHVLVCGEDAVDDVGSWRARRARLAADPHRRWSAPGRLDDRRGCPRRGMPLAHAGRGRRRRAADDLTRGDRDGLRSAGARREDGTLIGRWFRS